MQRKRWIVLSIIGAFVVGLLVGGLVIPAVQRAITDAQYQSCKTEIMQRGHTEFNAGLICHGMDPIYPAR